MVLSVVRLDLIEFPVFYSDQNIAVRTGVGLVVTSLMTHIALDGLSSVSSRAFIDIISRRYLVSSFPNFFLK